MRRRARAKCWLRRVRARESIVGLDFQTDMGRWGLSSRIFLLGVWDIEMEEFNCLRIIIGAESWGSIISPRVKLRRGARNFVIA